MKKAFTLAESLIVIAILAIIAAFVIPILVETTPNENRILYKKIFHDLASISQTLINDGSIYNFTRMNLGFMAPITAQSAEANFCINVSSAINTIGGINCAEKTVVTAAQNGIRPMPHNMTATNGARIVGIGYGGGDDPFVCRGEKNENNCFATVVIDVNGDAPPNKFATATSPVMAEQQAKTADRLKLRIYASGKVSTGTDAQGFALENLFLGSPSTIRDK